MKRFIFCILGAVLALSSCEGSGFLVSPPDMDVCFNADVEIKYSGGECKAKIYRYEADNWEFLVSEPFALEGLMVTVKGDTVKTVMYGLENEETVSESAVSAAKLLSDAFEAAIKDTKTAAFNDGKFTVSGQSESSVYTLIADEKGTPISLNINGNGVSAEFIAFTELVNDEDAPQAEIEE